MQKKDSTTQRPQRLARVLAALGLMVAATASQAEGNVRFTNPATLHTPNGYSHVVEVTGGKWVYVAGQVALGQSGEAVGLGDFRAEAQQVFANVKAALAAAGADFKDVIKLNIYMTDIAQLPVLREVRDEHINMASPPASTTVEVSGLFRDGFTLEIEAIAVVNEKKGE